MESLHRKFPKEMLLGAATAATQIEGGCVVDGKPLHDWMAFSQEPNRILNGDTPEAACEHWERWASDVVLAQDLGLQAYRLGLEWARIEPRPGQFDDAALQQYRRELEALRAASIEPMVTLHHFTLPSWVANAGGLLHPDLPELLVRFTKRVLQTLGDACSWWVTINEPNVVCAQGFLEGLWPPARRGDIGGYLAAQRNLLEAHVGMYEAIHDDGTRRRVAPRVGVAHHIRIIEPERRRRLGDRGAAWFMNQSFNEAFAASVTEGTTRLLNPSSRFYPKLDRQRVKGTQDFFGLNYYSRDVVRLRWSARESGFISRGLAAHAQVTDLGWEIYPDGLEQLITHWSQRSGLPVVVTENGIADSKDAKRPSFLVRHLDAATAATSKGAQVHGYFHWSLLDNFEWAEGYEPRFGLYEMNYETQERTLRPSGALYRELIAARGIPDDVWRKYGE